jgi:hypothetical protein
MKRMGVGQRPREEDRSFWEDKRMKIKIGMALLLVIAMAATPVVSQPQLPEGVETRGVDLWSDGTRISGDLFYPAGLSESDSYPAIVLSHGWGGERSHLNQAYAPFFAAEGFVVLTIDYRGWGDSDSRMVVRSTNPLRIEAVRELVDPIDQTEDIINAISFIEGEPGVDPERIGLWGSSYSGGHMVWVAAHDARVKCVASQVGSMDSTGIVTSRQMLPGGLEEAHRQQIQRVRGEIEPVPQTTDAVPGLRGVPYFSRMALYSPRAFAHLVKVPVLIIDGEKEELMDIREHGQRVAAILKENGVPVKYHVIPDITHYGVYREARDEALAMQIEWFKEHLQ